MSSNNNAVRKDADRHQMLVASHTAVPIGTANQRSLFAIARESKWLEEECRKRNALPLGRGHEKPYRLPKGRLSPPQFFLSSHFESPNGDSAWLATNIKCLAAFPSIVTFLSRQIFNEDHEPFIIGHSSDSSVNLHL